MCGINGIMGNFSNDELSFKIGEMNQAIKHRGPDGKGIYVENGIGLGHTRLSIIDLSNNGIQPMESVDKRWVIVLNGEIYNFQTLRKLVSDYPFKSATDTEVVLAMISKFGMDCISKLDGMFAIGAYDRVVKKIYLIRDRLGKKPLYYSIQNDNLVFSSEIRGVASAKLFDLKLSKSGLKNYIANKTVFSPNTIVEQIFMVPNGTMVQWDRNALNTKAYWQYEDHTRKELRGPYWRVQANIKDIFTDAVNKRLISDVPIGAFLSGGIDSSIVVATMAKLQKEPVKTVHISFAENEFSEREFANLIAKKYKTDHLDIALKPDDFLNELPAALQAMDHPSNDGCNSYLVSKKTKEAGLTVALSGIGGDELFGGYPVFGVIDKLINSKMLQSIPRELVEVSMKLLSIVRPSNSIKLKNLAKEPDSVFNIYKAFRNEVLLKEADFFDKFSHLHQQLDSNFSFSNTSILEMYYYLQNILLRDTDQMSMANQLEVRAPFLDKNLVEYSLSLQNEFKPIKPPKKLLIDAFAHELPEEIWNRKKMGFVFPWKYWVNNELKDLCKFNLEWLINNQVCTAQEIEPWIQSLKTGQNDRGYDLWNYVVLAYWLQVNKIIV